MKVTTLNNGIAKVAVSYFDPNEYQLFFDDYTQRVRTGEIESFSISLVRD